MIRLFDNGDCPRIDKHTSKQQGIQIFRAIMMIMVLLSHFVGMVPGENQLNNTPLRLLWAGNCAVIGFFFLSGYNYSRSFSTRYIYNLIDFALSRFIRLVPITVCAVLFANLVKLIYQIIAPQMGMVSLWGSQFWYETYSFHDLLSITSVNPTLWTMPIEIKYVFFIIALLMINRIIKKTLRHVMYLKLMVLICLLAFGFYGKLIYLSVFYIGILCYEAYGEKDIKHDIQWLRIIFGMLVLWIGFFFEEGFVGRNVLFSVGWIVILLEMKDINAKGEMARLLCKLGDYSLYLYVVHFPILLFFRFVICKNSICYWIVFFLCYILFTMASAFCIYKLDNGITTFLKKNIIEQRSFVK